MRHEDGLEVEHEAGDQRFVIRLPEGLAELTYHQTAPEVIDIDHTYVPPAARGRGVAAALVRRAVDYARAEGWKLQASCWYAAEWIRTHPEAGELLE